MQYVGKSVSGRGNIKCKGPKVETCLLPVQARRDEWQERGQKRGVKGQTQGFTSPCWPRMLTVRAYVISVGLGTPTTRPKHYVFKVNYSGKTAQLQSHTVGICKYAKY